MLKIKKNTLARLTLFMLMLCMTFTITSCSEDEESNVQVSKDMLIGQWILVKDVVTVNGESETDEYPVEAREEVLTFNSDGTYSDQWPSDNEIDYGTWQMAADDKIMLTMDSESIVLTLRELTSSKLVLYYEGVFEDLGETIYYQTEMVYVK